MERFLMMKVNTLPLQSEWTASTIYLVKNNDDEDLIDFYITTKDGLSIKHLITKPLVQSMIDLSLNNFNQGLIVTDITTRDDLVLTRNTPVWVLDATGDPTVQSGAALYLYDSNQAIYYKIAEAETMDIIIDWININNKPEALDALTLDADNRLLVNGVPPVIAWDQTQW